MSDMIDFDGKDHSRGCPYKRDAHHSCYGNHVSGPSICNCIGVKVHQECHRFFRVATLEDIKPEKFCCVMMETLFMECAEPDGFAAGCFDIRKYPNDGKDVWRNYSRTQFMFCPFCGAKTGIPNKAAK